MQKLAVALLALVLAACSSKEDIVEPTPLSKFNAQAKIKVQWSQRVGGETRDAAARLQPVISNQSAFVASEDGQVQQLDIVTGDVAWQQDTGLRISAGPVVVADMLVLSTYEGELVALNKADGTERWRTQLSSELLSPVVYGKGLLLVQSADGRINAVSGSGELRWQYSGIEPPLTLRGSSRPIIVSDIALVGLASGKVAALGLSDGQPLWERRIGEPQGGSELDRLIDIDADMSLDGDVLYAAAFQHRIVAMNLRSGQFDWKQQISTASALADDVSRIYLVDDESKVIAIDKRTGQVVWQQQSLRGRMLSAPTVFANYIVTLDFEGYLHILSRQTGDIVARKRIVRAASGHAPVVNADALYVLAANGKLIALTIEEL